MIEQWTHVDKKRSTHRWYRYSHKINEKSMDDDLESIDPLSIDERTMDSR